MRLILLLLAILPLYAIADTVYYTQDGTVVTIAVTSPELGHIEAWKDSVVTLTANDNPTECGDRYTVEESNAALITMLEGNRVLGELARFIIEDTRPGVRNVCSVRRISTL